MLFLAGHAPTPLPEKSTTSSIPIPDLQPYHTPIRRRTDPLHAPPASHLLSRRQRVRNPPSPDAGSEMTAQLNTCLRVHLARGLTSECHRKYGSVKTDIYIFLIISHKVPFPILLSTCDAADLPPVKRRSITNPFGGPRHCKHPSLLEHTAASPLPRHPWKYGASKLASGPGAFRDN